jgi:hypothetical protein
LQGRGEPTPRFASLQRTGDFIIDGVLPIFSSGQAELIDDRHGVSAVVLVEPAHGHTRGQFTVRIEGGGREAILNADLMHYPLQLRYLDWSTRFCLDPVGAAPFRGKAPQQKRRPIRWLNKVVRCRRALAATIACSIATTGSVTRPCDVL